MSLKVYFKIAASTTIIALLYIHMQMRIFELSYNGKDKEKIIHELNDSNGALSHQILTLKSANNLGNQLLNHDNSLKFMDNERVMKVMASAKVEKPVWNPFSFIIRG